MKRSVMVGGLVGWGLFSLPASAFAFERTVSVFSDEPMGGGDTAVVQSPAPAKDAPAAPPAKPAATVSPTGFVMEVGGGARGLGGDVGKGVSVGAGFADVELKVGYYPMQHVGLFAGIEAGTGSFFDGCNSCSGAHFSIPVSVQVAFDNRANGPYIEAGLALFSRYKASTGDDTPSETGLKMSSTADARFGLGWRRQMSMLGQGVASSLDIHFGVDIGQFDSLTATQDGASASADIADSAQSIHYAFALDADWHFAL